MSVPPPADPYGPPPGQPGNYGPPSGPVGYGPPPGQPFGYGPPPGQPGSYGPPPLGYPPLPFPPPRKRRLWLKIGLPLLVVVLLAIAGVLVAGFRALQDSPSTALPGDCLNIKEFKDGVTPIKVDCADQSANTQVALKMDGSTGQCPAVGYDEYSVAAGKASYKLCLTINAKQGDCFANLLTGTHEYRRVSCIDPSAEVEFVKVVHGQVDKALCESTEATKMLSYPQPPTTLCMKDKPDR